MEGTLRFSWSGISKNGFLRSVHSLSRIKLRMRIISGTLKGRHLISPQWPGLRPTSDRLRETLFNVLGTLVSEARVLDGFAGTGAIGIEALSRGAMHVTFIERDRRGSELIAKNLHKCEVTKGYAIIPAEVECNEFLLSEGCSFDLIVLDPPYEFDAIGEVLVKTGQMLTPDGILVLEHAKRHPVQAELGVLRRTRVVVSGDSQLSFYKREK